jgi:hypothetical protein
VGWRRLVPVEAVRQLKPKRAVLIYGHLPPVRIRLRPWFHSPRLRRLANAAVPAQRLSGATPLEEALGPVLRPTPDSDEGVAA